MILSLIMKQLEDTFASIYVTLEEASKIKKPENIIKALKEGQLKACGIYFCPDDEEQGKEKSLEDVEISKGEWRSTSDIKIAENAITITKDVKGDSHIYFYNDIRILKADLEQYIGGKNKQRNVSNKPKQIRDHNHISNINDAYNDYNKKFGNFPTNIELWKWLKNNLADYFFEDHVANYGSTNNEALIYMFKGQEKPVFYKRFMDILADIRNENKNKNNRK